MSKAINVCPRCGGSITIHADVEVIFSVERNGGLSLDTEASDIIEKGERLRPFNDRMECVCDECGESLDVIENLGNGEFVVETKD